MQSTHFSRNNFDLIRLFAALQVAICHTVEILSEQYSHAPWIRVLELFPGVPIFFFISGFLISRSYERNPQLEIYARNRAMRIYPALYVCLILNLLLVAATGYFAAQGVGFAQILTLFAAKATFFQFYNPDFMRAFGDGVLNGSLWTICVELQFYFLIPLVYWVLRAKAGRAAPLILFVLIAASLACNRFLYAMQPEYAQTVYWKLLRVSFLPWLCIFLLGVAAQQNFERLKPLLQPKYFLLALGLYVPCALLAQQFGMRLSNSTNPLWELPIFCLILLAAYTKPDLADRVLKKNDISYGVYIYHMVIVNMFLYYGRQGDLKYSLISCGLSLLLACGSWIWIERPSLQRKKQSLHPIKAEA